VRFLLHVVARRLSRGEPARVLRRLWESARSEASHVSARDRLTAECPEASRSTRGAPSDFEAEKDSDGTLRVNGAPATKSRPCARARPFARCAAAARLFAPIWNRALAVAGA
jgi:hypothetical protein